jgi:hypothetical protein
MAVAWDARIDGPTVWTSGTLFPRSSKKVARAIKAASGNRPLVVPANLSGFDGRRMTAAPTAAHRSPPASPLLAGAVREGRNPGHSPIVSGRAQ